MRAVLKELMVRRSFASVADGKRIGDHLPEVQRLNIECDFTPLEREYYEQMYADKSTQLFGKKKAQARTAVTWNTTTYHKLCLITTWLGLFYNLDCKVSKLKKFRANGGSSRTILEDLRKGQAH